MKYIWNLLISIDQLANTIMFGDPDETISSRMGKALRRRSKGWSAFNTTPDGDYLFNRRFKGCLLCRPICAMLDWVDPGHCEKAVDEDEGRRGYDTPTFILWGILLGATIIFTICG